MSGGKEAHLMIIKMFTFGVYLANCYVVGCEETKEAVIIDPTFDKDVEAKEVLKVIDQLGLRVKYIVNTHGHPDHTAGNRIIKEATGAPILIHENDAPMLTRIAKAMSSLFGFHATTPPADNTLRDGDVIQVGRVKLKVLHTPGHTKGSISLLGDDVVFTGDTLFAGSIGRTDFPGGSFKEIIHSIKTKLLTLPDHVKVYSGHGPASTIGEEKKYNPFLQT
jgi:glyoxylase-like metal-dependent hydrolase (beta-lactamase superfamily II)